ncbi:MAG: hypothetical protein JXD23_09675 [Spirochaetales bacterium]|nr:hypothetical protein [Spirochaetales bacterium]
MRKNRTMIVVMLAAILAVMAATGAEAQEADSGPMPGWVKDRPLDTDESVFFLGMGYSAKGSLAEALEFANVDIQTQIVRFIGVRVTATTSIDAKGTLDEFTANISKQIRETSSSYQAGLRVEKRPWYRKNTQGLTVYILAGYEKETLLKEKKRLEDLFQSFIDSVRIPEEAGAKLASSGRYYEAALRYIEAAVAAVEANLEDRDIALNRNLANAMAAVEKINLIKLNDNLSAVSGEEPGEAFRLKAASGSGADSPGVPRASVLVTYYTAPASGSSRLAKTVSLQTDSNGLLEFRHPVLTFAGQGKVIVRLDLDAYLTKLKPAGRRSPEKVAALARLALSKKQEFNFIAQAPSRGQLLALCVVDMDENGEPLSANQSTASGLRESLSKQGFKLKSAVLDPESFIDASEEEFAALVLKKAAAARRAVVGTASMESSYRDQDSYIITVSGTVKVIDLKSKKIVYEKSLRKKYVGTTLEAGRSAAFKQLGRELGLKIAAEAK